MMRIESQPSIKLGKYQILCAEKTSLHTNTDLEGFKDWYNCQNRRYCLGTDGQILGIDVGKKVTEFSLWRYKYCILF